ncbi:MAG: type II secretion system protein [Dissulfurispiraceae bacterium]|jgi:general secretion pathway protein I|nr:type II secretion system protein [Dissulfurispiraceae bacterium]
MDKRCCENGFTLLETIVALAIMSVGIVLVLQLFSGGLRSAGISGDYTTAVIYARQIMEEQLLKPEQAAGSFDDRYTWQADLSDFDSPEYVGAKIKKIVVTVRWGKARSVELSTLKLLQEESN